MKLRGFSVKEINKTLDIQTNIIPIILRSLLTKLPTVYTGLQSRS